MKTYFEMVTDGHRFFVGDISIIFPCSFAVGITQQYGIYVLLGLSDLYGA